MPASLGLPTAAPTSVSKEKKISPPPSTQPTPSAKNGLALPGHPGKAKNFAASRAATPGRPRYFFPVVSCHSSLIPPIDPSAALASYGTKTVFWALLAIVIIDSR